MTAGMKIRIGWTDYVVSLDKAAQIMLLLSGSPAVKQDYVNGKYEYTYTGEVIDLDFSTIDIDVVKPFVPEQRQPDATFVTPAPAAVAAVTPAPVRSVEVDPGDVVNQALRHSMGYEAMAGVEIQI